MLLAVTACASSKRESVWRGRAPVRLRGGGAVLSLLGAAGLSQIGSSAPALEAELGAARAALDASQKAARKARREARRREASLQAELDDFEAGKRADAPREPRAPALDATEVVTAAGVLPRDQATSLAVPETPPPPPPRSGVTRAFRLLNSAVLLSCAFGLAAAPSRSIGLLLQVRAPTYLGSTYYGCRCAFVPEQRTHEVHSYHGSTCCGATNYGSTMALEYYGSIMAPLTMALPWLHLLWLCCSRLTSRAMGLTRIRTRTRTLTP